MTIKRPKNTKNKGLMEFFVYPEKGKFVGVCLTFDIVEEGENLTEVIKNLQEVAMLHLKVVITKNLSDELLNRYAPREYWEKYFNCLKTLHRSQLEKMERKSVVELPYNSDLLRNLEPLPA